jgi:CheY-like chemotaxis protein
MSQDFTRPKTRQTHHILIIDDSARLRQTLADLIVANCLASGKIFKVFHSDKDGKFTQSNEVPTPGMLLLDGLSPMESAVIDEFTVYTAPSPRQALFVINSPVFSRLTIISDVMMPADSEVGLIGMLEAIARRKLPVNLLFASSDAQNFQVVAKLVETGKAYFLVKQGTVWEDLSRALVQRAESFQFKTITSLDFEGMQKFAGITMRAVVPPLVAADATKQTSEVNLVQRSTFKPYPSPNTPPRVEETVTPPPAQTRPEPARPSAPPQAAQPALPAQPPKPDLPLAPNPVLIATQAATPNNPVKPPSTEAPKIGGFMPVTPTTPPYKPPPPPLPAWEDQPDPNKILPENRPVKLDPQIPGTPNSARVEIPPTSLISPAQTKTPLSQFADIPRPREKKVFVLFRPFAALARLFKKR